MLIIVEGPDGAGKSTLIESARQKSRYFVRFQTSGPPPTLMTAAQVLFWLQSFPPAVDVVCDRIPPISDRVYGPILRNIDLFAEHPINFGIGKADVLIYCRPPDERILYNATHGQHLPGVADKTMDIITAYDKLLERIENETSISILPYDYTKDDPTRTWATAFLCRRKIETIEVHLATHRKR